MRSTCRPSPWTTEEGWIGRVGNPIELARALRDARSFVIDSGVFEDGRLNAPREIGTLGRRRLFSTYATLVESFPQSTPLGRTREVNIRRLTRVLAPDEAIAERAYELFADLRPLAYPGPNLADIYIAAVAIRWKYVVVTHDRDDFGKIPEVEYLDAW